MEMESKRRRTGRMTSGNVAFDLFRTGNAVPELERQAEQERERLTNTELQRGHEVQTQVHIRPQQKIAPTAIAGFALVAMLAVGVLSSYVQLNAVYADTVKAQKQLTQLETTHAKLAAEDEEVFDSETLSAVAEKAGLIKPTMAHEFYLELSDPNNTVVFQQAEELSPIESCWNGVVEFFGSIGEYFA